MARKVGARGPAMQKLTKGQFRAFRVWLASLGRGTVPNRGACHRLRLGRPGSVAMWPASALCGEARAWSACGCQGAAWLGAGVYGRPCSAACMGLAAPSLPGRLPVVCVMRILVDTAGC